MAPWSSWIQSTSQQQHEEQPAQKPPQQQSQTPSSAPLILPNAVKPAAPSPTQPTTLPFTSPPPAKLKDASPQRVLSSTELWQMANHSLQTGAIAGGVGIVVGAGVGIIRSAPPTLFAIVSGIQWFALGSSYMASRDLLWHSCGGEENMNTSRHVITSGVAGGVAGMLGGIIRGPKNIVPGMLFFGTAGTAYGYALQLVRPETEPKAKTSWLDSKWSPMKRLSDKEYIRLVEEKILRIDADIAIIDENIASLKSSSQSPVEGTAPKTK